MSISAHQQRQLDLCAHLAPDAIDMLDLLNDDSYPHSLIRELSPKLDPGKLVIHLSEAIKVAPRDNVDAFCSAVSKMEWSAKAVIHRAAKQQIKGSLVIIAKSGEALDRACRSKQALGTSSRNVRVFPSYVYAVLSGGDDVFEGKLDRLQERYIRLALRTAAYILDEDA